MTDSTGNPPADGRSAAKPPQRPLFPAQAAPVGPLTPPVAPSAAPLTPPASTSAAPLTTPALAPSAGPLTPLASSMPTYDEQLATVAHDAEAHDRNPGRNPGKTLGIVGLALAIPFAVLGLIFSILGLRKSKKAGKGNVLAWIGLVLSTLMIVGSIGVGIFALTVWGPQFSLAQACAEAGPGQYTDQDGTPVTCT